jgi:NADPH-dependent ferric siderophore reductase
LSASMRLADNSLLINIATIDLDTLYFSKIWLEDAISEADCRLVRIDWSENCRNPVLPPSLNILTVVGVEDLSPKSRRITFRSARAEAFNSADRIHLRLMLNYQEVMTSGIQPDKSDSLGGEHPKPVWRTYTISSVNPAAGTLKIDFVLHGANGPGANWALQAKPNDRIGTTGAIGKGLRPAQSYLLVGDETSLPAIRRLVASFDETVTAKLLVEVASPHETTPVESKAKIETRWLYREKQGAGSSLPEALRGMEFPDPSSRRFVWVACEAEAAKHIRSVLLDRGISRDEQLVAAYWHI